MSKNNNPRPRFHTFCITLITPGGTKVHSIVYAPDEDTAMDIALRNYEGLEVYDTEVVR